MLRFLREALSGMNKRFLLSAKFIIVLILVIPGFLVTQSISLGQSQGWSTPTPLSDINGSSSWFPDVAADPTGRVHVVWSAGTSVGAGQTYDTVMYTNTQDNVNWTPVNDIVALPSKGAVTRPTLISDQNGILHLTYRSYSLFYTNVPAESVVPSKMLPAQLISTPDNGYFSRIAIDNQNHLHLVYSEDIHALNCVGCFHIFYRQSMDGGLTWSSPVDVSPITNGTAKPQIVIDKENVIHVVWEIGRGGDLGQVPDPASVMYTSSSDSGATWSTPKEFQIPGKSARNITIGLVNGDDLVVAYLSLPEDKIYYQTSTDHGVSWSVPKAIPGISGAWSVYNGRTDDYAMATDSAANVHLVLVGQIDAQSGLSQTTRSTLIATDTPVPTPTSGATETPSKPSLSVLHLVWNGSSWSQPEAVSTISGDVPEWPRLAIANGNQLNLVWFVRDEEHIWESAQGQYRVWYAHGVADAPDIPPVALPTREPSPQPTQDALMETPLSLPATLEIPTSTTVWNEPNSPEIYTESGYLSVIAKSLLPSILLIVAAMVFLWFRRR